MEDIYDRSKWPTPEANPLVQLLRRGHEWYTNREIVAALGLGEKRALLSNGVPTFGRMLSDNDTAVTSHGQMILSARVSAANAGGPRLFSRRALVLAAIRTNTVNAAAFRDWLASSIAEDTLHG